MPATTRAWLYAAGVVSALALVVPRLGRWAARVILSRQGRRGAWTGPVCALACLGSAATGIVVASLVLELPRALRTSGLASTVDSYVIKPYVAFLVYGTLPALVLGLVCGWWMRWRIARMLCA